MAYKNDPTTGKPTNEWETENDTVESRLPGLMAKSSPLMEKAQGDAMRTANSRGLQNSSIAAGEGVKAALGVVTPIASQDAAQTSQKNLAAQGFGYNTNLQGQQIKGQKEIVGIQEAGANQRQASSDAAAFSRLQQQGVQDKDLQLMRDAAEKTRQGIQLTSDEKMAYDRLNAEIDTADKNRASTDKNAITTAVGNANATYTNYVNSINNNTDIPAETRNKLIADASARRDAELLLVEQIYNVDLDWPAPNPPTTPTTPNVPNVPNINVGF